MIQSQSENRAYKRVQFFLLPLEKEYIPVWVFNSNTPGQTIAALLIDLSTSGMQVLTDAQEALTARHYEISFFEDDEAAGSVPPCQLARAWSESEGSLYAKSGFEFVGDAEASVGALLRRMETNNQSFVRCALRELIDVSA